MEKSKIKMSPHFQFYAEDFLTGIVYLTNDEVGIYVKMMCKQWTDGEIPKKRLALFVGIEWESFSDELKSKFIDCGETIINKRIHEEREKQIAFRLGQSENGSKGGRPPKNTLKTQKKASEDRRMKNEDENIDNKKGKKENSKKPIIPTIEEFVEYALENKPKVFIPDVELKFKSWVANDWKTAGKTPRAIKNWKTTLLNSLPYIKENELGNQQKISRQTIDTVESNSKNWNVKRN